MLGLLVLGLRAFDNVGPIVRVMFLSSNVGVMQIFGNARFVGWFCTVFPFVSLACTLDLFGVVCFCDSKGFVVHSLQLLDRNYLELVNKFMPLLSAHPRHRINNPCHIGSNPSNL